MHTKSVLLVGGGGDSDALKRELEGRLAVTARTRSIPFLVGGLRRHIIYFSLAWYALWNEADCILVWEQYVGLYLLLLFKLFPWRHRPILLYYVIYRRISFKFLNLIKYRVMRFLTNAKACRVVYFMSQQDLLFAATNPDKRQLLADHPFYSPYIEAHFRTHAKERYFFAGGASNRNHAVIGELARMMPAARFKVVCLETDADSLRPLKNVEVFHNVPRTDFEDMLLRSIAVILPLKDPAVMSGQLVCLAAMQAGKPIFVTRKNALSDWIDLGQSQGFISMFDGSNDLRTSLSALTESELALRGSAARKYYLAHHDVRRVYRTFAQDLIRICE